MAKPLTDDERERIEQLLGEGKSARDIAELAGRSVDTVSRIARSIGHDFGRTNLARARKARSAYCAEARAEAAEKAQEWLQRILDNPEAPRPQLAMRKGGGMEVVMVGPDAKAVRDLANAVHTLQRTVLDIDRHDNRHDEGLAMVDDWLRDLVGGAVGAAA